MSDADLTATAASYQQMSESELMDIARKYDELTEDAQTLLREEFSRRSLEPPTIEDEEDEQPAMERLIPVTIRSFRDLPEALVARSLLESEGIRCFLLNENMIRIQWGVSNALGGIRLQVMQDDAAAADEILSQPIPATVEVDTGEDFKQPACPKCASLDVVENDTARKIGATSLFFSVFSPLVAPMMAMQREDLWKCNNCGCTWYDDESEEPDPTTPVN